MEFFESYTLKSGEKVELLEEYFSKSNLYWLTRDYYGNYGLLLIKSDEELEEVYDIDVLRDLVDLWEEESHSLLKYWADEANNIDS